ncbi:MAG: hypothetical protein R3Y47_12970 [Lachnospiraceae bacterium]
MNVKVIDPKYFMLMCKYIVPQMTYESYLIEVINGSTFFRGKCSFVEQYKPILEQSHGEADAYTSTYQLDFKLLVDEDVMRAYNKNKPKVDYSRQDEGFIFVTTNDNPIEIPQNNILEDIMKCKCECLLENIFPTRTMKNLAKNLSKDKNLFIYYPYEYSSDRVFNEFVFEDLLNVIFREILQFRNSKTIKDTFVCIKVNNDFLIYEWVDMTFKYRDKVNEILCSNYLDARLYSVY